MHRSIRLYVAEAWARVMPFISIEGGDLYYLREGVGPVVVLLHSLGGCANMWRTTIDTLKPTHTVIAPDARGHGHSSSQGPFTVERFAADALAIVKSLNLTSFAAVGISMGGQAAMHMALRAPEDVRALVLADTSLGHLPDGQQRLVTARNRIATIGIAAFAKEYTESRLQPSTSRDIVSVFAGMVEATLPHVYIEQLSSILDQDFSRAARAITAPTLVLVGEHDVSTPPAQAEELRRSIVDAQMHVLPGANHLANLDQPEAFNRAVCDFLRSHTARHS